MPARIDAIIGFWEETGPQGWYNGTEELDARIRTRHLQDWETARAGGLRDWLVEPRGALAYLILTDQFPRNMFRDDPRAFATDRIARDAAVAAIARGLDLRIDPPIRQFFYLPFMHAESTFDQDRCICLMIDRMGATGADNLLHARAHREIIRRYGRFPYRNAVLGRRNSPAEDAFFAAGGYGAILKELS